MAELLRFPTLFPRPLSCALAARGRGGHGVEEQVKKGAESGLGLGPNPPRGA